MTNILCKKKKKKKKEQKKKKKKNKNSTKHLVSELTHLHMQSDWGFKRKMVQVASLTTYYNYLLKKKE